MSQLRPVAPGGFDRPLVNLRRFLEDRPKVIPGERCEMCAEPIPAEHGHLVNLESRSILCSCRACYLLFTITGAARGRYRAVPDRYLRLPSFQLSAGQWDDLQIPVRMAFFFFNSSLGRFAAFYPSPAGATESLLPLETWAEVVKINPVLATIEPDVEALLVYHQSDELGCYLVPIDACYELVGLVKLHWKGFAGGDEAWSKIDGFFDGLHQKSRTVEAEG